MGFAGRLPSIAVVLAAALAGALGGSRAEAGAGAAAPACVHRPASLPHGRAPANGATIRVPVGAVVYVVLILPDKYTGNGYPLGFPWQTTRSSDAAVLAHVALCPTQGFASLESVVSAFRAERPGTARLVAPLTMPWRSARTRLHAYRARVEVVPR